MDLDDKMRTFTSYHGTTKSNADKIRQTNVVIHKRTVGQEIYKANRGKLPGSLGYGFYTFVDDYILAEAFASKFSESVDVLTFEVVVSKDELLDLDEKDTQRKYHEFRRVYLVHAKNLLNRFNVSYNPSNQHVMDGIILEEFSSKLKQMENITVKSVTMCTFTPLDDESSHESSHVNNGQELCVKSKSVLKLIE